MKLKELIEEINDLPIDLRIEIVSQIIQGINAPDPEIEKAWAKEARRRLDEFERGETEAIPGEQVMKQLRKIAGK